MEKAKYNKKQKIALISGITGQCGSYLAELLLDKSYYVHGIIRRSSSFNTQRLNNIYGDPYLSLHYGDVTDSLSLDNIVFKVKPDEIYHLGAQSHVKVSFEVPKYTAETDAIGTLNFLEAMRKHCPDAKFYNASTSELYGKVKEIPQNELTPFYPRSPYGCAKLYSYWITKNYREAYNLFAINGILFNNESERRGSTFVTKKIVEGLVNYIDSEVPFYLGNLYAKRDWGYAPEYVEGMWKMLQQKDPEDFVLATGEVHTIKEFINECLKCISAKNIKINKWKWIKDNKDRSILWDVGFNRIIIGIDEKYYRPAEVNFLQGDATKAKVKLNWKPKIKFKSLVKIMIEHELSLKGL